MINQNEPMRSHVQYRQVIGFKEAQNGFLILLAPIVWWINTTIFFSFVASIMVSYKFRIIIKQFKVFSRRKKLP